MKKVELKEKADLIREKILQMVTNADSGHPGGAMGMADVFAVLHYRYLKDDPENPDWEGRDRFLLSNGHACPVLYSILADKGYFEEEKLNTFRQLGSILQGHPSTPKGTPGVEMSSGSLGHGLSYGVGISLSGKIRGRDFKTYVSISDAECQEGQVWEAASVADKEKLGNLCAIVDYNNSQIDGPVSEINDVAPLADKWRSFNWRVLEIDGHDYDQIDEALATFERKSSKEGRPTVIISQNVLGKGVSFMEGDYHWHHGALSDEQMEQAMEELKG